MGSPTRDATGMLLHGRDADGRYLYRVLSTGYNWHTLPLTHDQRVVFARLRQLVDTVSPGTHLYPARLRACRGRGSVGVRQMWLPVDATLSEATARTIAHELVHNDGLTHGRTRNFGHAWVARQSYWVAVLARATCGWTRWPEVKGLRDTLAPAQRKARAESSRAAALKAETGAERWLKKHAHAASMLAQWERKQRMACGKVKRWGRALRMAERKVTEQRAAPERAP